MAGKNLLLGVDIGNSAISLALMRSDPSCRDGVRIVGELRLATQAEHDEQQLQAKIGAFCDKTGQNTPLNAVLCSVVPALTPLFRSTLESLGMRVHEVRAALARSYGIAIDIADPSSVGSDLVADCVAARSLDSAVIVDTGTATKVIALQRGTFLGVTICPGPGMLGASLGAGTAQLPAIVPARPSSVLGRDTLSAMRSGIYYQALGGINETLSRVLQMMPDKTASILTGGYSHLFQGDDTRFTLVDPYYLHRGLWRIAHDASQSLWTSANSRQ